MIRERRRLAKCSSLSLFLLCACTTWSAERLVIISPHWEGLRFEFARAFSDWHKTNHGESVDVDWRDLGGTGDDLKFVISEFGTQTDGIGIDLFFGGGADPFVELAKRDLLAAYRPPDAVLKPIPPEIGGVRWDRSRSRATAS